MSTPALSSTTGLDIAALRDAFPSLDQKINGKPLVYLDRAASSQKPLAVIDAISHYYKNDHANVHRGAHALSDRATECFENARNTVRQFINAAHSEEIIWTRGTTEAINLVANSYGASALGAGDVVLVSAMEHHSNIVPWQLVAARTGATVQPIPVTDAGEIDMAAYRKLLSDKVKMVAVGHVSNALGTVNPIEDIIRLGHDCGAKVLIDGAQGIPHFEVDVQSLACDFYVFSGHKVFGPTGIGVLFGKRDLLDAMPPWHGGGEMISTVSFDGSTWNTLPFKFEAGTPNIAGAVGLAAAFDWLNKQNRALLTSHESNLLQYAHQQAEQFEGMRRVGTAAHIAGVFSFLIGGTHPSDVGMLLDQQGIAVRSGDHCAQPIMKQFGVPGTVRASFSIYNTMAEVDALFDALAKAKGMLI